MNDLLIDVKVAVAAAAATIGTSLATALEMIPNDIGKLGTIIGIVLSVLIGMKVRLSIKKMRLEIAILEGQENDRRAATDCDRRGSPRRTEDAT